MKIEETIAICTISNTQTSQITAEETVLNIRKEFQNYNAGRKGHQELFICKKGNIECFGIEFAGGIFYLYPSSKTMTYLLLYDGSLMPIMDVLAEKSEAELDILKKYIPTLYQLALNGINDSFRNGALVIDNSKVSFIKEIPLNMVSFIKDPSQDFTRLIQESANLINIRNECVSELTEFHGYTNEEHSLITIKDAGKKAIQTYRIIRFISNISDLIS